MTAYARERRLRRYPALMYLAVAASLALLLPSTLTLPTTGPATLAEYAPVPGRSQAGTAALADVGLASSAGIGGGGAGGGAGGPTTTVGQQQTTAAPGAGRRRGGTKRCVGNPPRQTEDPMSPPCVAFFDGDNGGATARGVTGDEITVVIVATGCFGSEEYIDFDAAGSDPLYRASAGLVRYFNDRYQMYGRRIHAWEYHMACPPGQLRGMAAVTSIEERLRPFAVVNFDEDRRLSTEATRRGIVTLVDGIDRELAAQSAPHMLSYPPDLQQWAAGAAAVVCHKLAGRPARYSGMPADREKRRVFAMSYVNRMDPERNGARLFREGVRERCGPVAGHIHEVGGGDRGLDVARWRTDGVTTVIQLFDEINYDIAADRHGSLFSHVCERIKELDKLRDEKQARLAALTNERTAGNDPSSLDLVEELLTADVDTLRSAPEAILRRLFDAFQLRVTYDHRTGHAVCRVVVRGDTVPNANAALQAAHGPHGGPWAGDGNDSPNRGGLVA